MKKKTKTTIIIAAAAVLLLIIGISGSVFTVRENEYACIMRFSKIESTVSASGLHFKVPFIDSVLYFPKDVQIYDIPPSEVLTAEKQNMTVDSYVLWQISDPVTFYKTLGTTAEAESRLDVVTYNAFKNYMGTLNQSQIINMDDASERNDIYANITNYVASITDSYGIKVVDVKIKRIDMPELNEQAVYTRMISERTQMSEKYIADGEYEASVIRNEVDKEVKTIISNAEAEAEKIIAEGEAEYMRMLADAYNTDEKKSFYEFVIAIDTLKASLTGENKTVILGKDSAIAKLLTNP